MTVYNLKFSKICSGIVNATVTILKTIYKKTCNGISWLAHNSLNSCGRYRTIKDKDSGESYLERYYLFLKNRETFPFNIFVHKFLKSDPDDMHDHPWPYCTVILKGGYWEHTLEGKFWRRPFSCRCNKANSLHRIELDPNSPDCWTLFIPGKKEREWGFKTGGGWINNEEYNQKKIK